MSAYSATDQTKTGDRRIRVAIIDDGCFGPLIPNGCHWSITSSGVHQVSEQARLQETSHASICVKIIQKYADCALVDWHDIQILDLQKKAGNITRFVSALLFCQRLNINILHLSVGSTYPMDFPAISAAVHALLEQGTIIIAASSNRGLLTYPANIPGVIGVANAPSFKGNRFVVHSDRVTGISFRASAKHVLRHGGHSYVTLPSNSYAAPVLTAAAINELSKRPATTSSELYERLFHRGSPRLKRKSHLWVPFYDHTPVLHIVRSEAAKMHLKSTLQTFSENSPEILIWQQHKLSARLSQLHTSFRIVLWDSFPGAAEYFQEKSQQTPSFLVYGMTQVSRFASGKKYPLPLSKGPLAVHSFPAERPAVVALSGFRPDETLLFMKELQLRFWKERMYPVSISNIPCGSLFGVFSAPSSKSFSAWMQQVIDFTAPQVLLVGACQPMEPRLLSLADYHISAPLDASLSLFSSSRADSIDSLFQAIKHKLRLKPYR